MEEEKLAVNDIRKSLLAQRDRLNVARSQMSNAFDKYLLTFATGSLVLSISFTDAIIVQGVSQKNLLAIGWVFLITTVISTLFSFNFSENAHERQMEIIDAHLDALEDERVIVCEENCWIKSVIYSRWLATFSFISGIVILSIFYFLNLK